MTAKYTALKSYSGTAEISAQITGHPPMPPATCHFAMQKPRYAAATSTMGSEVVGTIYDGKALFSTSSDHKGLYIRRPMSPGLGLMRVVLRAGMTGPGLGVLLTHPESLSGVATPACLSLGRAGQISGVPVITVISQSRQGSDTMTITYSINAKDYSLQRMVLEQTLTGRKFKVSETYTNIKINPKLPASSFVYTPAPGAKSVEAFPTVP
jgi:hypothetical protein